MNINKYIKHTPSFTYIIDKYFKSVSIDHIAHRSLSMNSIVNNYTNKGFVKKSDIYTFPRFNVQATWLQKAQNDNLRVFVSEYNQPNIPDINSYRDFVNLSYHNQYLAWTILHKHDINHMAITVQDIEKFFSIIKKDSNCKIATDIQISRDGNLKQFSLQADKIPYKFADNTIFNVPYTFVEFIERLNGREGFESENADKIFDSTKK